MLFNKKKKLHSYQLDALRATNGLLKQERYKLEVLSYSVREQKIYNGEKWMRTQQDIVSALEYAQSSMVRQLAEAHGFVEGQSVDINLKTGEIVLKIEEPKEKKEDKNDKIDIKESHDTHRQTPQEAN